MSELILKGTDLFMKKTGSADKLHICGNAERMLFLIIGIHNVLGSDDCPMYCYEWKNRMGDDCNSIYDTWMSDGIYGI